MDSPTRHRLRIEILEDRSLPAPMVFESPTGNGTDSIVLRLNDSGSRLELFNNGVRVDHQVLSTVERDGVIITGAADEGDTLTLDYSLGVFSVPISFNGGIGEGDSIAVSANGNFTLTPTRLSATVGSSIDILDVEHATLTGGAGNNILDASAFGGTTTLSGAGGNDTLTGGFGNDVMNGGPGADTIVSLTGGDDLINGGADDDTYILDPGSTITLTDDGGNDTVNLSRIGGSGVAATVGATAGTIVESANPDSTIAIATTIETLIGTNQDDVITSTNTTHSTLLQRFLGLAGNDTLRDRGTAASVIFAGGTMSGVDLPGGGSDTYDVDPGSTVTIIDDGGNDTITLATVTSGGATVMLGDTSGTATVPGGSVDIVGTLENIIGTPFDDFITGNSFDNIIDGGGGTDRIIGGGGNDTISGGTGSDTLEGGDGDDFYVVVPGSTEIIIDTGGVDTVSFAGALRGISLNMGASGPQVIDTAGNRVQFVGVIENVIGTAFDDVINGNSADNLIIGGAGNDRLSGHQGRDILIGGLGSDRLVAGADEDILIGGTTSFDNNLTALRAIQAEWSSSRNYATRVANLRGTGTGPRLNGTFFLKAAPPGQTVFDDGAVDTLTGSQQSDWFFLFTLDDVTDQNRGEEIN